ncbi:hypothetical protein ARMGADRAFT_1036668 [Armillaria gallica]|uniref:Uncharacterized protein n=1 Tax=Armillaria gallica TaxID=47427 RepID=A0A2H3CPK4_ARMGA|nr:hypothetical protein ARMGADRAFT_1036668 [Armillaria gallica]
MNDGLLLLVSLQTILFIRYIREEYLHVLQCRHWFDRGFTFNYNEALSKQQTRFAVAQVEHKTMKGMYKQGKNGNQLGYKAEELNESWKILYYFNHKFSQFYQVQLQMLIIGLVYCLDDKIRQMKPETPFGPNEDDQKLLEILTPLLGIMIYGFGSVRRVLYHFDRFISHMSEGPLTAMNFSVGHRLSAHAASDIKLGYWPVNFMTQTTTIISSSSPSLLCFVKNILCCKNQKQEDDIHGEPVTGCVSKGVPDHQAGIPGWSVGSEASQLFVSHVKVPGRGQGMTLPPIYDQIEWLYR